MKKDKKIAIKANVEIQKNPEGYEDEVAFHVYSEDGSPLTSQQILEAIAEALLYHWEYDPIESSNDLDLDS